MYHKPGTRIAGELAFVLLLLAFSLYMLWEAYKISGLQSYSSPGAFPIATTLVMMVTGLIIVFNAARAPRVEHDSGESVFREFVRKVAPGMVVGVTAAILTYMWLLERLGFLLSSYLFLLFTMWLLGSRRILFNLWVGALALALVFVVFQTIFSVPVPRGTWLEAIPWLEELLP